MRRFFLVSLSLAVLVIFGLWAARSPGAQGDNQDVQVQVPAQTNDQCSECHINITPGIVVDWQLSKHSTNNVGCAACHGERHNSMTDAGNAGIAGPEVCSNCHAPQVEQFRDGKHALAWGAMKAMPNLHWQPMAQVEGLKGCGSCHRVGLKTEGEARALLEKGSGFGASSCDVCHSRHLFSVDEARSPQVCMTCHMGPDHSQWEMYSSSKHGERFLLKQSRMLPEDVAAPTCQSCHFQDGNHANRTAWGYLALRLPYPPDSADQWAGDRAAILQGLGVLDPAGKATPRLALFESYKVIRFTEGDWQAEREKAVKYCNDCHSINFVKADFEKGDRMIREADALMAEGIRIVAALYEDGLLKKPDYYSYAFPDLLMMQNAPTLIEQKLFSMFHEYRMRTFQGAFHSSPVYSSWFGWSSLQRALVEVRERAADMRAIAGKTGEHPAKDTNK